MKIRGNYREERVEKACFECKRSFPFRPCWWGEKLYRELEKITLKEMKVPVVSNADAKIIKENTNVKELLKKQIYSPVLWQQSVETMIEAGVDTFVEIGPGSVLKGLIKKINRSATVYNISDPETLDQTIKELNL